MRVLTQIQTRIMDELMKKPRSYDQLALDLGITRSSLNNNLYWLRQASGCDKTWQLINWWKRVREIKMWVKAVEKYCLNVPHGAPPCMFFSQGDGSGEHACSKDKGHEGGCSCECGYEWNAR